MEDPIIYKTVAIPESVWGKIKASAKENRRRPGAEGGVIIANVFKAKEVNVILSDNFVSLPDNNKIFFENKTGGI